MWVDKVKVIANKRGYSLKDIASLMDMSETNLYKCFKRGSIETKHLVKLANTLGISTTYFFDEESNTGHKAHAAGDRSVAVAGDGNFFSGDSQSKRDTAGVNKDSEKVKMLKQLLAEKERLLVEKEKLLEEKERVIKLLMGKR